MRIFKIHNSFNSGSSASAFDDIKGWWRADTFTGSSPNIVLTDKSSNGNNMTQAGGTLTPGIGANGQARMQGNSSVRLNSSLALYVWPNTVITIGKRQSGVASGFFGHINGSLTMWNGYETDNNFYQVNSNNNVNSTSLANTDGCWVSIVGYGFRANIINGLLGSTFGAPNLTNNTSLTTSIGTEYRGLNCEWQECLVWDRILSLDELDEVHAYVNSRYGMSIPLWSSYTQIPVLGMWGDSNSIGRALRGASSVNMPPPYYAPQTGVYLWQFGASNFIDYDPTQTSPDPPYQSSYFGADLTFAYDYRTSKGGVVGIVKSSFSSTGLAYTDTQATIGFWDTLDEHLTRLDTHNKFNVSVQDFWKLTYVQQGLGKRPVLKGMLWHLGAVDALDATAAAAFQVNLQNLATIMRSELGSKNAKFIIAKLHGSLPLGSYPYRETVRSAQVAAQASITNSALINLDAYSLTATDHVDYAGMIALGQQAAALL